MDEASLETSLNTYKQQLEQIETVLKSAGIDGQDDLIQLKNDLTELVNLTEGSLLSLKKSKLMSLVDSMPSEGSSSGSANQESNSSSLHQDDPVEISDQDFTGDDIGMDDISGVKCRVPYTQEWGVTQYHNAMIFSFDSYDNSENCFKIKVLFANPVHRSMVPCPYFLEGSCRFSDEECRYSHGHVVDAEDLKDFVEPDFSLLVPSAPCLAKDQDGVWHPARVEAVDPENHQYRVAFDYNHTTPTLGPQSVLPLVESSDSSSDESDDDDGSDEGEEKLMPGIDPSKEETYTTEDVYKPSGASTALGKWENHTRGIGSKLMAKMGYEFGKGLGKDGEGRTHPVEIVILPSGKSLDVCAQLREKNLLPTVTDHKKLKKAKAGSNSSIVGGERKPESSVFNFLNKKLKGKKGKLSDILGSNFNSHFLKKECHPESLDESNDAPNISKTRHLNIQLMKTHEEMKNVERSLVKMREALDRNKGRDRAVASQIEQKISSAEQYLSSLKSSEKKIEKHQTRRKDKKKLAIF